MNQKNETVYALQKATRELSMLLDTMLSGWVRLAVDDNLRIVMASPSYYQMTGYTRDESLLAPFDNRIGNLVVPEDLPRIRQAIESLLTTGGPISARYRIRLKDGSVAWKLACTAQVEEIDGERVIDVYLQDTTETVNTEKELSDLINNIPGGVVRASAHYDDRVLVANDTFYRQIGYTPEEFNAPPINGRYLAIVHPDDRVKLFADAAQTPAEQNYYSLNYRIITQAGETLWFNARAIHTGDPLESQPAYLCIFTDITAERERQRQSAINEERYRIISEQTRDTVFDWDLVTDLVQFSPTYEKMFGFPPPPELAISALTQTDIIYPDDKAAVEQMIREVHDGKPYAQSTYRAKCADGSYLWCRNRITTIFDDNHRPMHAIGVLSDIDDLKREAATLKNQAMRDSMTGLLNRGAMRSATEQLIAKDPCGLHAFIQFDVDHFKQINDFMGHGAGDTALQKIAALLGESFREADVTGRMGGDEFAILLPAVSSGASACRRAEEFCRAVHGELRSGGKIYPLTISVGIALYPEHGRTYQELYEHADLALYRAKNNGGDGYFLYSPLDGR